ncbi:hypothetical protein ABZ537_50100, partial [Streptomyces umbrinus]
IDRSFGCHICLTGAVQQYCCLTCVVKAPTGGWLRWYPKFPRVLFVLTGAGRQAMDNRISDLQAMAAHHPLVAELAREVPLGAVVLEDLEEHGATSDVWVPLVGGGRRSWTEL